MFFWKKTVITCNNTIIWFSNKNKYILKMCFCLPDPLENALEYFIDISFFANFFVTLLKQFLEPLDNWIETVIQKKNAVQIIFVLVLDTILFFSLHVTFTNINNFEWIVLFICLATNSYTKIPKPWEHNVNMIIEWFLYLCCNKWCIWGNLYLLYVSRREQICIQ